MAAVDCTIQHGTITNTGLVDEPNMLVQSLSVTPNREKKVYKGGDGCTKALRFTDDPTLKFDFDGYVAAMAGLTDQHPGTAVASLANYQGAIYGFDNADGVMIYEDPSRERNTDDPAKCKFSVMQYPFVS